MGKHILFCLPGPSFSREFVQNWTNVLIQLSQMGHHVQASFAYDPNVFYARSKCLGCDTRRGINQKPFDGKLDYDHLFWVDSDILFTAEQVVTLLNHDKDIVCGAYIMADNTRYPIVRRMDAAVFLKQGHYDFLDRTTLAELREKGDLVPIEYTGFGFLCVRKGVFEALTYPHFTPQPIHFSPDVLEYASEDVSWCMRVREMGYTIYLDPSVAVHHQKLIPLI